MEFRTFARSSNPIFGGYGTSGSRRSTSPPSTEGCRDEIHALLAEGPSRNRSGCAESCRQAHQHRPRSGVHRRCQLTAEGFHRRACDFRRETFQRRQAEAVHCGYGNGRAGAGRVRRTQRAHGHESGIRATRRGDPGNRRCAESGHHPRRGIARHAVFGARVDAGRRSHRHY